MKNYLPIALLLLSISLSAQNKKTLDSVQDLGEVIISTNVIFGNKYVAKNRTGSAYYVSPEELSRFNYTDINRVLRAVPGVNIYEEDGFGLRPNISLRGTSPERSSKISIMEDGVLIAPAPYSAPAAYYFPSIARMEAVEILKGSSQVQYGPFTTGGAINMVSTQIPDSFHASIFGSYGTFNTGQFRAKVGDSKENIGYMVEYLNYNSDGFKNLLNNRNTGFDKNDVVAKFRINSNKEADLKQALEFKFQFSDEVSHETYLGLTDDDFNENPFDRYAASQKDKMVAEHLQFSATHKLDFSSNARLTTVGYYNRFQRNWYKLNNITLNGNKLGIADIISQPNSYPEYMQIVRGQINSLDDALQVKANNRLYHAKGVQTKLDYHFKINKAFHDIEVGLRYHYDEEDRFQWVDNYNINNQGIMALTQAGEPGTDANRVSSAKAFAAYAMYKFKYKKLTVTPGLRYENIVLHRDDYGRNDVNRTGTDLSSRENKVDIVIPGVGFSYKFNNMTSIFGGVHKGFSPPSNTTGQKPEESINYELGSRFSMLNLKGEVVAFYNDYSNLLGSDLAATGGTGSLEQFNAGEVNVVGLEALFNYNLLAKNAKWNLPISLGYTYTHTEFQNSFGSDDDLWGEVEKGDQLPYIPEHQINLMISLEHNQFEINASGRYLGEFRTLAGSGSIPKNEKVDSNFVLDFSAKYHFNTHLSLTGNVINALDSVYAVSRVPAGLRPGMPFAANLGLEFKL
ncbi:TonB-dependent receptor family protein [Mangrovimonas spongiae]|uniref:TonB-dependent receptor n=1 Tax=Mangrovimonas spongiae TaxID=2494697 RepID=A0A3R9NS18_9FLAO|nr:TonB-dependent receptor [Mangrovimonas spongiae]RSK40463.1 TonB-dependent receptor [Mangrovimonas spongiae]